MENDMISPRYSEQQTPDFLNEMTLMFKECFLIVWTEMNLAPVKYLRVVGKGVSFTFVANSLGSVSNAPMTCKRY